jgi:site-specific DNA recombinase
MTGGAMKETHEEGVMARAAIYLRVSTKEQAEKDGDPEGYSIPAQRDACRRKAAALHADVVEEFLDAGESARSVDRPQLQRLLKFVAQEKLDFLIVHKVDRLARNRADDVMINLVLQQAGVTLVSCSENIDETPSGVLLHGIMASIAEFYSRNLGTEALKGMTEKARRGGTVVKAPLGYRNVGKLIEGREARTVEFDQQRFELVKWAFEAYATGDWTLHQLHAELTARGLTTVATMKRTEKPVPLSRLHAMLQNRYYIGKVNFKGVEYDGTHKPLVSLETFAAVQAVLDSHRNGEKQRVHQHYLKGTLVCGVCQSRLSVARVLNRHGSEYHYFFCLGRHQKRTGCNLKSVSVESIEKRVEAEWANIRLDASYGALLQELVQRDLTVKQAVTDKDDQRVHRQLQRKRDQRQKLLEAYYAGAVTIDMLKVEQVAMTREIEALEMRLVRSRLEVANVETVLRHTLDFLYSPQESYLAAPPSLRRQLNQAIFDRIEVFAEGPTVAASHAEPFKTLLDPTLVEATDVVETRPAADGTIAWVGGMPAWLRDRTWWQSAKKPTTGVVGRKGLKDDCLVNATGRHSNLPANLGLGLKDGGLAAPTGFEPVSPPWEGGWITAAGC